MLSVVFVYKLIKFLFDSKLAFIVSLLYSMNILVLHYSGEARQYTLFYLLSFVSLYWVSPRL